ncbi:hypothetical protein RI367_006332 [Sorochytrium milnesiophthora]
MSSSGGSSSSSRPSSGGRRWTLAHASPTAAAIGSGSSDGVSPASARSGGTTSAASIAPGSNHDGIRVKGGQVAASPSSHSVSSPRLARSSSDHHGHVLASPRTHHNHQLHQQHPQQGRGTAGLVQSQHASIPRSTYGGSAISSPTTSGSRASMPGVVNFGVRQQQQQQQQQQQARPATAPSPSAASSSPSVQSQTTLTAMAAGGTDSTTLLPMPWTQANVLGARSRSSSRNTTHTFSTAGSSSDVDPGVAQLSPIAASPSPPLLQPPPRSVGSVVAAGNGGGLQHSRTRTAQLGEKQQQTHNLVFSDMVQDALARGSPNIDWQNCELSSAMLSQGVQYAGLGELDHKHRPARGRDWWGVLGDFCVRLSLSSNDLTTLPADFSKVHQLRYLRLDNNQLEHIPPSVCTLSSLETLDVSRNKITQLPNDLQQLGNSLKTLVLSHNAVARIPQFVAHMGQLRVLKADHNPLVFPPHHVMQKSNSVSAEKWMDGLKQYLRVAQMAEQYPPQQADMGGSGQGESPLKRARVGTASETSVMVDPSGLFRPHLELFAAMGKTPAKHQQQSQLMSRSVSVASRVAASFDEGQMLLHAVSRKGSVMAAGCGGGGLARVVEEAEMRVGEHLRRSDADRLAERQWMSVGDRRLLECGRGVVAAVARLVRAVYSSVGGAGATEPEVEQASRRTLACVVALEQFQREAMQVMRGSGQQTTPTAGRSELIQAGVDTLGAAKALLLVVVATRAHAGPVRQRKGMVAAVYSASAAVRAAAEVLVPLHGACAGDEEAIPTTQLSSLDQVGGS